jgi:ferredoxin, 2Fe-2S
MPRLNVVTRSGQRLTIDGQTGTTLKEALMAGGIDEINALSSCGGCCSCGTCHVYIDAADLPRLPAVQAQEDDLLSIHDERKPNSRLSCQICVTEDLHNLTVTVAPEL